MDYKPWAIDYKTPDYLTNYYRYDMHGQRFR